MLGKALIIVDVVGTSDAGLPSRVKRVRRGRGRSAVERLEMLEVHGLNRRGRGLPACAG